MFTHVGNNHPGGNGRRANDLGRNGGWAAALVGDMEDKGTGRYGNGSSKWAGGSSAAQLSQFQKAARSASGGVLFGHDHAGDSASKRKGGYAAGAPGCVSLCVREAEWHEGEA